LRHRRKGENKEEFFHYYAKSIWIYSAILDLSGEISQNSQLGKIELM
jgi:hypothetical protein